MTLAIELGWPAKQLSPNARVHHMVLHRFKKAAKNEAGWSTKIALHGNHDWGPADEKVAVHFRAYPPINRNRDEDNLVASCKAHLDGIASVLGVDDSIFKAPTVSWEEINERGRLVIELG